MRDPVTWESIVLGAALHFGSVHGGFSGRDLDGVQPPSRVRILLVSAGNLSLTHIAVNFCKGKRRNIPPGRPAIISTVGRGQSVARMRTDVAFRVSGSRVSPTNLGIGREPLDLRTALLRFVPVGRVLAMSRRLNGYPGSDGARAPPPILQVFGRHHLVYFCTKFNRETSIPDVPHSTKTQQKYLIKCW